MSADFKLVEHVEWSRNANIYAVNVRQYTPDGTFNAFAQHLPRLQQLGVNILWLLPIQPIGVKERKGTLGSYYSVRNYTAVNPEFGSLADFKNIVQQAHALGMKVIIDWVANHTAWDHAWVTEHPDWYKKNAQGQIHAYTYRGSPESAPEYWTDVVGLDFNNKALWPAMTAEMAHWLHEADIDGFRCDVAALVPLAFWQQARKQLDAIKPVFMLAEAHEPEHHDGAFDMTYDWKLYDLLKAIAKGQAGAADVKRWWLERQAHYPAHAFSMNYTANHDSNSWHGHDTQHYGDAFEAMAVLAATLPGMPLIYSGQEAVLDKQLQFFERDPIEWKAYARQDFYAKLLNLKAAHAALANGQYGAPLAFLPTDNAAVLKFQRALNDDVVTVTINLSTAPQAHQGETLAPWAWSTHTT